MKSALILHLGSESSIYYFIAARIRALGCTTRLIDMRYAKPRDIRVDFSQVACVVLVRYWPARWIWCRWLRAARHAGLKCIYFMDDDLFDRESFRSLPRPYARKLYFCAYLWRKQILRWCDELWVSTGVLVTRYSALRPVLVPLALAPQAHRSADEATTVIAYHGTGCHRMELLWLLPIISRVQSLHASTVIELYGSDEVARIYSSIPRVRVHRPLTWQRYFELTTCLKLDLMLCPLLDHPFNMARSPVKFIDAARSGAVGLYSHREPYASFIRHGEDGLLIEDVPEEWVRAISLMIVNESLRRELADNASARLASMA